MIRIAFKSGAVGEWPDGSYKDYQYDGKCFVILGSQGIEIYNVDTISSAIAQRENVPAAEGKEKE